MRTRTFVHKALGQPVMSDFHEPRDAAAAHHLNVFLDLGFLYHHTTSPPITTGTHTRGAQ